LDRWDRKRTLVANLLLAFVGPFCLVCQVGGTASDHLSGGFARTAVCAVPPPPAQKMRCSLVEKRI